MENRIDADSQGNWPRALEDRPASSLCDLEFNMIVSRQRKKHTFGDGARGGERATGLWKSLPYRIRSASASGGSGADSVKRMPLSNRG
jgi:hypothetical protein